MNGYEFRRIWFWQAARYLRAGWTLSRYSPTPRQLLLWVEDLIQPRAVRPCP